MSIPLSDIRTKTGGIAAVGDLLARARAGDAVAFSELVVEHKGLLIKHACQLSRDPSTAEDLALETLEAAWYGLASYRHASQFDTWLCSILLHRYATYRRRARSRPSLFSQLSAVEAENAGRILGNLPDPAPSPAETADQHEVASLLNVAGQSLPKKYQQIVRLLYFEGKTLAEIAVLQGCSIGTVKSRHYYALKKLRKKLKINSTFCP